MIEATYANRIELLSKIKPFTGLCEADLYEVAVSLRHRSHPRGEIVYHQDDPAGSLFILTKGLVKIQLTSPTGGHVTFALIWPGGIFGTISPVDESPRAESAAALRPCEVLILDGAVFRKLLRKAPDVAMEFLEIMATRRRRTTRQLHDAIFLDISARLAKVLLEYSSDAFLGPTGDCALNELNQTELASLVWATRESVNRWLHFFEHQGWISRSHESIQVLRTDRLRELIEIGSGARSAS
ncbi:MAG: Crp/Fnr family transcriptional regulator [Dehalococcoidia bacterium]